MLTYIADKYNVSNAAVVMRWLLDRGCAVLLGPMSMTPTRGQDNLLALVSFGPLAGDEMVAIGMLEDVSHRQYGDVHSIL